METIKNYLDRVFINVPETEKVEELKSDLLKKMEKRYNHLINEGKTDSEATAIVLSEFRDIDKLVQDIKVDKTKKPEISEEQVTDYLKKSKKSSFLIGFGVDLCILGAALIVLYFEIIDKRFISGLSRNALELFGIVPLLILVAIAVGMFIYSGIVLGNYKDIEYNFLLPENIRNEVEKMASSYQRTFVFATIAGVALLILSPITLFFNSLLLGNVDEYGVVGLLIVVAIGVFLLIYYGGIKLSYTRVLSIGKYPSETQKVVNAVAAVVWPLAVIIFLVSGLIYGKWHINWIVFPITGLLYGMFAETYRIIKQKKV